MLWSKVLLVYDGSENSLRAVEYVAKVLGRNEGLKVTIFGVHEKIPRHDLQGTSPVVDKLQRQISAMRQETERGQARLKESKILLAKGGIPEQSIDVKYGERKQSLVKDIITEAQNGGYGTIVVGKGESKGLMSGGNIGKDLVAAVKDQAVCVV